MTNQKSKGKPIKKVFALLMAFAMMVTLLPEQSISVLAAEEENTEETYTLTLDYSDGRDVTTISGLTEVPELDPPEKEGYIFEEWSNSIDTRYNTLSTGDKLERDTTIYAIWKKVADDGVSYALNYGGKSFKLTKVPWNYDEAKLKNFVIPDTVDDIPVTIVGMGSMDAVIDHIETLVFGNNVEEIQEICNRYGSTSVKSITLPNSIKSIDLAVFMNFKEITEITIPAGVRGIYYNTFYECTSLETVKIEGVLTQIGEGAFANCSNLKTIYYGGTESQWRSRPKNEYDNFYNWTHSLVFGEDWNKGADRYTVEFGNEYFVVNFDPNINGWTYNRPEFMVAKKDTSITEPLEPYMSDGYKVQFEGWYKDKECTQKWNFAADTVKNDMTLYAKWESTEKKVTFNYNGKGNDWTKKVTKGSTITEPYAPTVSGYELEGWYKDEECIQKWNFETDTVTEDMTLYAKWVKKAAKYTIYATALNGGSISPSGDVDVTEGTDQTFTITPEDGYEINTVKVDNETVTASSSYTFTDVKENHRIEVTFKKRSHKINTVEITGIDAPVSGRKLDTTAVCNTEGISSNTSTVRWTPDVTIADYNSSYTANVTVSASENFAFADTVTATVNGKTAANVAKNEDGTITVTYTFDATEKDKLISITTPQAITVANGTGYENMRLPKTVQIVTEGKTVTVADVIWDTSADNNYDPSKLTEQIVKLNGTVTCPDTIDSNQVPLTTSITVTVSAAGIAGEPIADVPSGTYTEEKRLTLASTTEGAEIYYTMDGSEPKLENGSVSGTTKMYVSVIHITGEAGKTVEITVKAFAVKNGMKESPMVTFHYTICIPEVTPEPETPKITSQPVNTTIQEGETATFTVTATGKALTYQWQINRNDGKGFVPLENANKASYTTSIADKSCNGFQYQCVVSNSAGTVTSDTAVLNIKEKETRQNDDSENQWQMLNRAKEITEKTLADFKADKETKASDLADLVAQALKDNQIYSVASAVTSFQKTEPTETAEGKINGIVTLSSGSYSAEVSFDYALAKTEKPNTTQKPEKIAGTGVQTSNGQVKLSWNDVPDADGYQIYVSLCNGKNSYKLSKDTKTLNGTIKNLDNTKSYKFYVVAYKNVDGKKVRISKSMVYHVTLADGKYTNVKEIKVPKSTYTLDIGEKKKLTAKSVKEDKTKNLLEHAQEFRYYSSDASIAVVSKNGEIKAKKPGSCIIYIVANNGVVKEVKVIVS